MATAKKATQSKEGGRAPGSRKSRKTVPQPRQQEYVLGPFGGLMTREEFEAWQARQKPPAS
jgi:hypothetical protein